MPQRILNELGLEHNDRSRCVIESTGMNSLIYRLYLHTTIHAMLDSRRRLSQSEHLYRIPPRPRTKISHPIQSYITYNDRSLTLLQLLPH
jgi:hypothetical protein